MDTFEERLARIEAAQKHQGERLDRIVDLMERTVRLEERHDSHSIILRNVSNRIDKIDNRLKGLEMRDVSTNWRVGMIERLMWVSLTLAISGMSDIDHFMDFMK